MRIIDLPREVLLMIISLIPPQSQKTFSLVSKSMKSIMLPLLFEAVVISPRPGQHPIAEGFIQRILELDEETENTQSPDFRKYVRRLRVKWTMDEQQLETFGRAISTLENLEHLHWDVLELARSGVQWNDALTTLHQELPKLRSLSLVIAQDEILLGNASKVVVLTKLRKFEVDFAETLSRESVYKIPETLVELIRGANNIESLSLYFEEDYEHGAAYWGSLTLLSALSSDRFPNLRKFSIVSSRFGPNDEAFQQFIRNHGGLQKIVLNTGAYDENWWDGANLPVVNFTPQYAEELLPSIRHFGGPGCFIGPLLKSNLSRQLEILELIEPACKEFGTVSQLLQEIGSSTVPELPRLKALAISIDSDDDNGSGDWENVLEALSKVAAYMPMLEELLIRIWQWPYADEWEELFQLLNKLPRLRILAIPRKGYANAPLRSSDERRTFHERARLSLPQLKIVNNFELMSAISDRV